LSSIGGSVDLSLKISDDVWLIEVDPSELQLALVNLALNARGAMPRGGRITIGAQNVRLRPADTPQKLEGDFVALTVADTGAGIPPDILPKIFDPFFTTKPVDKGTGLGLSQVHGFVHQSGGTVTVTSTLGKGTGITLYLPRAKVKRADAAED